MARIIPTNQNRQFYVAKGTYRSSEAAIANVGDIAVGTTGSGNNLQLYFVVKGAKTNLRSDLIPVKNIDYAKAIPASAMEKPLKKVTVTVNASAKSDGNAIVGQDYVLRINFSSFFGGGIDNTYIKDAVVHATASNNTLSNGDFYTAMKKALDLAFSREPGASKNSNPYLSFSASSSGLVIEEKEQDTWDKETYSLQRIIFDVQPTTVYNGTDDVIWGTATTSNSSTTIKNGKQTAELEWFCMGERGDQYRKAGYPNYIPTKYLVEEDKEYNYLELHYAFTDTGVNSYRSEKDITIVFPKGASGHEYDVINEVVGAINSATSLGISTLTPPANNG